MTHQICSEAGWWRNTGRCRRNCTMFIDIDVQRTCDRATRQERWVGLVTWQSRPGSNPTPEKLRFETLAIPFTPLYQCHSEETLKAVSPFYLGSTLGEVKEPTSPHWNVKMSWTPPVTLTPPPFGHCGIGVYALYIGLPIITQDKKM